ncbi:MAG: hypothetical protein HOM55_10085 [Proteobacteria bacterium]|nr:hypothetical protein [Pseudomonadota bacterium]
MKSYLLLSALALSITACGTNFSGQFDIKEPLTFVNLSPRQAKSRAECQAPDKQNSKKCISLQKQIDKNTTIIKQGVYNADVISGKKEITLKIQKPGSSKTLQELSFKMANGINLPRYSGEISLSPQQTGQSFGVQGIFDTEELDSETTHTTESCKYRVAYRWCGNVTVNDPKTGQSRQVYRCQTRYRTQYGSQDVAYYYRYTDKEIILNLVKADGSVVGEYYGDHHGSNKIYAYQGYCNTGYRGYY